VLATYLYYIGSVDLIVVGVILIPRLNLPRKRRKNCFIDIQLLAEIVRCEEEPQHVNKRLVLRHGVEVEDVEVDQLAAGFKLFLDLVRVN